MTSLQGVAPDPPPCTCGTSDDRHTSHCYTVAWAHPNAMRTLAGDVFYPSSVGDARHFARYYQARPLRPDVFPYELGGY